MQKSKGQDATAVIAATAAPDVLIGSLPQDETLPEQPSLHENDDMVTEVPRNNKLL